MTPLGLGTGFAASSLLPLLQCLIQEGGGDWSDSTSTSTSLALETFVGDKKTESTLFTVDCQVS